MKVLMFGWEFPPHISGGLGTACFGLTHSLVQENVNILFVVPTIFGGEPVETNVQLINASEVILPKTKPLSNPSSATKEQPHLRVLPVESTLHPYSTQSQTSLQQWNYMLPEKEAVYKSTHKGKRYTFSGTYGPALLLEVTRYAEVAGEIASQETFDVIHSHDWLTFPAGIKAKELTGKPLIVHVHATEYDRAGHKVDSRVLEIERAGMLAADKVIAVSNWTKKIITRHYKIPEEKVVIVYNGVHPKDTSEENAALPPLNKPIVTFLGRITHQKGPQYFVEAARLVLEKNKEVHFIMAGAGDMLPQIIERVAHLRVSTHFHFTGFLKSHQVDRIWKMTNIYVMPSVSEPFGIATLEAIQAGVPVIISNQSGVSEVIKNAMKVDFWNTEALANAILELLKNKKLAATIQAKSCKEIKKVNWRKAAKKVNTLYNELVH